MPTNHQVKQGETVSQIAQQHGFQDWNVVWNADANATLRSRRGAPERIQVGDTLVIPDPVRQAKPVTTGEQHQFKLVAPPPLDVFEVGFADVVSPNAPVVGLTVELEFPGTLNRQTATTDDKGVVRFSGAGIGSGNVKIHHVIDKQADPTISYDSLFAFKTLATGQSHALRLPDKRKVADAIAAAHSMTRRATWGAAQPKKTLDPDWDYDSVVIHHSGNSGERTAKAVQEKQMKKEDFDDIAYEYVVQLDGLIFEGRHIAFKSAANSGHNTAKLAILVAGDFQHQFWDDDDDPTTQAIDSVVALVTTLKTHFPLKTLVGHRDLSRAAGTTECPGDEPYKLLNSIRARTALTGP